MSLKWLHGREAKGELSDSSSPHHYPHFVLELCLPHALRFSLPTLSLLFLSTCTITPPLFFPSRQLFVFTRPALGQREESAPDISCYMGLFISLRQLPHFIFSSFGYICRAVTADLEAKRSAADCSRMALLSRGAHLQSLGLG